MTSIQIDPIEAIKSAPVPYDLYREVHKGLRHALFGVTELAGSADHRDTDDRGAVAERARKLFGLLHTHHHHEDMFIQPVLKTHAPDLSAEVDKGHGEIESGLVALEQQTDELGRSEGGAAVAVGLELYRELASFTSTYLVHMELEEGAVMAALRGPVSVEELFALDMALRSSVPPPTMCAFLYVMMPAVNIDERTAMLGGMKAAGVPPEIFETFRMAIETSLTPQDYRAVARRVGLL